MKYTYEYIPYGPIRSSEVPSSQAHIGRIWGRPHRADKHTVRPRRIDPTPSRAGYNRKSSSWLDTLPH